jgi:hypothetical protein
VSVGDAAVQYGDANTRKSWAGLGGLTARPLLLCRRRRWSARVEADSAGSEAGYGAQKHDDCVSGCVSEWASGRMRDGCCCWLLGRISYQSVVTRSMLAPQYVIL